MLVPLLAFLGTCWYDRGVVFDEERTHTAATLGALAQHVQSMLQDSALTLDLEMNETKGKSWLAIRQLQEPAALLRRLTQHLPEVEDAFLVDPDGIVAAASGSDHSVRSKTRPASPP